MRRLILVAVVMLPATASAQICSETTLKASVKGSALTPTEADANMQNIIDMCSAVDALSGDVSGGLSSTVVADDSHSHGDSTLSDSLTASNYLALAGGTMTGSLVLDNLGLEFTESDTNPSCGAGTYNLFADLSEAAIKACQNGSAAAIATGSHFSPDSDPGVDHASYVAGHSNGANCSAGSYPLGVDAAGVAESCTDATTEIDSAISTHAGGASAHHAKTVDASELTTGTIPAARVGSAHIDALTELGDLCAGSEGIFRNSGDTAWECAAASGGLSNVVEDLTPQLGGDLDVNAKSITDSGGTVRIDADGDGNVELTIGANGISIDQDDDGDEDFRIGTSTTACDAATGIWCVVEASTGDIFEYANGSLVRSTRNSPSGVDYAIPIGGFSTFTPQIQMSTSATATTPIYTFYNDQNTGIGRAGDDELSLIANGVAGLKVEEDQTTLAGILSIPPKATAPSNCTAATDIYTDTSGALCFCTATDTWTNVSGVGSCT